MVLAWAIVPELFTGSDPLSGNTADRLQAPSPRHFFGTDHLGRDIYTRVVFGAGESVLATVLAVGIGLVGGSLLGLLAGFLGGRLDAVIMRAVDVLAAIPDLLLSLVIVTALGFGAAKVAIAVGVSAIAGFARVMRSSVIQVRSQAYVETATCLGLRPWTVIRRHVLPNALGPVVALAAISFGTTVLAIAALSFLGYGSPPPAPEWGAMVADGRNYLTVAWWLTTLPGLVIVMVVLSTNRLSRGLEAPGGRPGRRRR
jgi:peptide/nickel transport system permease protein